MAGKKSKQELAANRLCNRLTSLRATLRKDERDLLDQMVCSAVFSLDEAEVVAHSAVASAAASAVATAVSFAVVDGVYCAVTR